MGQQFGVGGWQALPPDRQSARVDRVLGRQADQDDSCSLPPLDLAPEPLRRDYGPRPWLEYIVDLVGPTPCPRSALLSVLTERALEELGGPELYGRAAGEETWTFAQVPGIPEELEELALGWNLAPRGCDPPNPRLLRHYRDRLGRLLRPLERRPRPRETPEQALDRSIELIRLRDDWDVGVALVLRAPWLRRYSTRDIWDAATALGLRWGHLDLFHWHNRPGLPGDEHLFSLWSVEEPGTFSPECAAAGVTVPEIALGFSIPRSPDPLGVFDRMVTAGRYLQSRLGSKLLVGQVAIASERVLRLWRGRVRIAADELTAAGFPPGSSKAMQLF
jgi:cell division protein ZipA